MLKTAKTPSVGHLYLGQTSWLQHAADLRNRLSRVVLAEMLQDAVRIRYLELALAKWKETSIGNQVLDVETKFLRNTSRCHYGTQGRIDADHRKAFSCCSNTPATPTASDIQ